jgi:hypothetical protein
MIISKIKSFIITLLGLAIIPIYHQWSSKLFREPLLKVWEIGTSPESWREIYNGFGSNLFSENDGIILEPKAARKPQETHANLVLVKKTEIHPLKDFLISMKVSTEKQLRTPLPNPWEALWVFFNYSQSENEPPKTNYFILKKNGIEIGKAFEGSKQDLLFTQKSPQLVLGKIYWISIIKSGDQLEVLIDGSPVIHFSPVSKSVKLYDLPGSVGIYSEDARVHIYDFSILPLNFNLI